MTVQLGLLVQLEPVTPRKRVAETSARQFRHLVETGQLAKRRAAVLACVAILRERTGVWPTACELHQELERAGEIPADGNPNHTKPRLTELAQTGVIVRGPKRASQVSGITCLTWAIREAGA